jgi:hypothetical protein
MKSKNFSYNNSSPDFSAFKGISEFDEFISSALKKSSNRSGINEYLSVIQTINRINVKLEQFSVS